MLVLTVFPRGASHTQGDHATRFARDAQLFSPPGEGPGAFEQRRQLAAPVPPSLPARVGHRWLRTRLATMAQASRADPVDDLQADECEEEELDTSLAGGAGTPQEEGEEDDDLSRSRHWHYRLVVQKTLTGEIKLRKWVSDEGPQYTAPRRTSDLQAHMCSFHDCGKAFPDASALRKHMHTHGEKQYICQVEVRHRPACAASPWRLLSAPSPTHSSPSYLPPSLAGVRQAIPR